MSAVGAGYALLVALAWRTREAAVLAIEERDGVRFYVEPGSMMRPITLVRTPGPDPRPLAQRTSTPTPAGLSKSRGSKSHDGTARTRAGKAGEV